jgi:hypothetical protein
MQSVVKKTVHVYGPVKCESYNSTQLLESYENFWKLQ